MVFNAACWGNMHFLGMLCKYRGASYTIVGELRWAGVAYDDGPLGVEGKRNVRDIWGQAMV